MLERCCDRSMTLHKGIFPLSSLPSLANIDHIDAVRTSLPQIWLHVNLQVLRAHMTLCSQEHLNILRCRIEDRGEVCGRHGCDWISCQSEPKQEYLLLRQKR